MLSNSLSDVAKTTLTHNATLHPSTLTTRHVRSCKVYAKETEPKLCTCQVRSKRRHKSLMLEPCILTVLDTGQGVVVLVLDSIHMGSCTTSSLLGSCTTSSLLVGFVGPACTEPAQLSTHASMCAYNIDACVCIYTKANITFASVYTRTKIACAYFWIS